MTNQEQVSEIVTTELLKLSMVGVTRQSIQPGSLIVEELGLDSLRFVDLTVGLEAALQMDEFPMQRWIDKQMSDDKPLTVQALVTACLLIVESNDAVAGA